MSGIIPYENGIVNKKRRSGNLGLDKYNIAVYNYGIVNKKGGERTMEMSEKQKEILDKAEDLILRRVEHYLKAPENMSDKDIYNFHQIVITFGRIQGLRKGNAPATADYGYTC